MKAQSEGTGVIMKSTPPPPPLPPPPPAFVRVSERDLTEIELYSVDSISDLHRTHPEQHSKGVLPPRPPPPSTNGTLRIQDRASVCETGHSSTRPCTSGLKNICTATRWRYVLASASVFVFLVALILIFIFLVQQSSALHTLLEILQRQQEASDDMAFHKRLHVSNSSEQQPQHVKWRP